MQNMITHYLNANKFLHSPHGEQTRSQGGTRNCPLFRSPIVLLLLLLLCCNAKHFLKLQVHVYQLKKGLCRRQVSSLSCCPVHAALNTPEAATAATATVVSSWSGL